MKSFTLIELIIVMVIVAVLATLGITHYGAYQETTMDREAEANLAQIIAAERIFLIERQTNYYISAVHGDLNQNLRIFLPTANLMWNYHTEQNLAANPPRCCAQATRNGAGGRTFRLCTNGIRPVAGACGGNAASCN